MNLPRRSGRGELAELAVYLVARGIELSARIDRAELGVIESVVGLGAELQLEGLPNGEVLEYRQVPVGDPGSSQKCFSGIAQRAHRRNVKATGVEVAGKGPLIIRQVGIAGDVDAGGGRRGAADISAIRRREADSPRTSRDEPVDAGNLPAV